MDNLPSLMEFSFEGRPVRTVTIDGEPWFIAKDVCEVLGLAGDPGQHLRRLDDDEKGLIPVQTPGGIQRMAAVNEPGLYALILGSRKSSEEVRRFKRWVTHEVLPTLRRTGTYSIQPLTPTEALLRAVQILAEQERQIRALQAAQAQQQEMLTILGHRIDSLDTANIEGDLRQRFERMVKRYAWAKGISYQAAWREFDQAYNTAFRTNLTLLRQNYAERHGLDEISRPEYLERTGKLEDAIRIADKMLAQVNRARAQSAG
ncbi:MAG: Bro-N domain-containing protein [Bacillota bacterium]